MLNLSPDFLVFCGAAIAGWVAVFLTTRRDPGRARICTLAAAATVAFALAARYNADRSGEKEATRLRTMVEGVAPTYAAELTKAGHAKITEETPPDDPIYLALIQKQMEWLSLNPGVADIYTFNMNPAGEVVLLVDSETDYDHNGKYEGDREGRTEIGEVFDEAEEDVFAAFGGEANFDPRPATDRWGTWVSANVPMFDETGKVEAVLGVDYDAALWLEAITYARAFALAQVGVVGAIALLSLVFISKARQKSEERRLSAERLERALEQARLADRAKSTFLAMMSHELRTPMSGVLGMTDLLLKTQLNGNQRHYAETIGSSTRSLLGVINDILDFTKLESGRLELSKAPLNPRELVEEVAQLLAPAAFAKSVEVVCEVDASIPEFIEGDALRIRQVLINLLGNAVKFTAHGEIVVELHYLEPVVESIGPDNRIADSASHLVFAVRDTGIGISTASQGKIFETFVQADASTTRKYGGSGLGLSICRRLVELMGGNVGVDSNEGEGSRFWFTIPRVEGASPATPSHIVNAASDNPRVALVVVGHARANDQLVRGLRRLRLEAKVDRGEAASFSSTSPIKGPSHAPPNALEGVDVVFLDQTLPREEIDRFESLVRLAGASAPAVVLLVPVGAEVLALGTPHTPYVLRKPISEKALRAILVEVGQCKRQLADPQSAFALHYPTPPVVAAHDVAAEATGPKTATLASPAGRGALSEASGPRILLVEDNPLVQEVARAMFEGLGCHLTVVDHGEAGVAAAVEGKFDLVFMDGHLPDIDGLTATRRIRRHEEENHGLSRRGGRLPIVALTADALQGQREAFLVAGTDDYMTKPFTQEEVVERLRKLIGSAWAGASHDPASTLSS